ncbi:TetR/AcrR family transcriptional regulator [Goodfellowiella coeruleoviolacea]|uniref:Transcriptional regulator, TetR family n=1 Tax=Goodfellowiella coeruleoviolacea TaxID=334858 RepID=A0AAE3GCV8_9PSEU|nr:TetR/AcrR family transcriptional regulator [Goodfellowiella coeruleoviolacea]MCP2165971.1 transcriptional regulator, TetR family [Goodfellowiella coeruleoviolacea]
MATSGDSQANAVALLWEQPGAPRRGPRPTLTLDAIARAGIAIADADGLAAVTMQRVAAALDVTKMALYRYVPGKDELVALMTDTALGEPPRPGEFSPGDWRAQLDGLAHWLFEQFWAHPWALEATVGARAIGPNELTWLEHVVAALAGSGLRGGEVLDVAATLAGHVRTVAQQGRALAGDGGAEQHLGLAYTALVSGREDRFPALAALLADATEHADGQDQALDFGLNRILDGIALLIDARTQQPPAQQG